ncbi:hypothetical protein ACFE04_030069 [Oxalis oulophora]
MDSYMNASVRAPHRSHIQLRFKLNYKLALASSIIMAAPHRIMGQEHDIQLEILELGLKEAKDKLNVLARDDVSNVERQQILLQISSLLNELAENLLQILANT